MGLLYTRLGIPRVQPSTRLVTVAVKVMVTVTSASMR